MIECLFYKLLIIKLFLMRFPSGTHDLLVGDKRGARRGQTRPSWETNGKAVGDTGEIRCLFV